MLLYVHRDRRQYQDGGGGRGGGGGEGGRGDGSRGGGGREGGEMGPPPLSHSSCDHLNEVAVRVSGQKGESSSWKGDQKDS